MEDPELSGMIASCFSIQESLHSQRKIFSTAAGELFIIIRGRGLSLGRHENKGSWGEPHESVFAQHFHKETI